MRTTVLMVAVLLAACAGNRYQWNLSHQHLMPNASKLPREDIEEITRLVSVKSGQPILAIARTRNGRRGDEVKVVTSYPSGETPDDNGFYELRKENGHWRIIWGGAGLSYSVIGLALSED